MITLKEGDICRLEVPYSPKIPKGSILKVIRKCECGYKCSNYFFKILNVPAVLSPSDDLSFEIKLPASGVSFIENYTSIKTSPI